MMVEAGHCGKCGAPYYVPLVWNGIVPPPVTPTCACWNLPRTITTDRTVIGDDSRERK